MATQLPDGVRLLRTLTGQGGMIGSIGWSPDGRLLATPSMDGTVRIWNTNSGACLGAICQDEYMFAAAFDPDGRILATGGSGGTSLWNVDSGKFRNRLASDSCYAVAFSPHGRVLASANDASVVTLWELSTGTALCRIITGHGGLVRSVAFDGEGGMLATGSDADGAEMVGCSRRIVLTALCDFGKPRADGAQGRSKIVLAVGGSVW
jgi:WD40 repeat protein